MHTEIKEKPGRELSAKLSLKSDNTDALCGYDIEPINYAILMSQKMECDHL